MKNIIKKCLIYIITANIIICFVGCEKKQEGKYHTPRESEKKFSNLINNIENICDKYGLDMEDKSKEFFNSFGTPRYSKSSKVVQIDINKNEYITIFLDNECNLDNRLKKGRESLLIYYDISGNKSKGKFNVDLFVDLINEMSFKSVNKVFCKEFIEAPEKKYPNKRKKYAGLKVSKKYIYNAWEDTGIYYNVEFLKGGKYKECIRYNAYVKE